MVAASLEGGIGIIRAGTARAGRQRGVLGALEVSSFAFMHSNESNQQRFGEIGRFSRWLTQTSRPPMCDDLARPELLRSTWRYRQGRCEADRGPEEPSIDPARAFEVCHGGVFACSKSAMYASRSKSCREPVRGEMRGIGGQIWSQRAREGVLASCGQAQLARDANLMFRGHSR